MRLVTGDAVRLAVGPEGLQTAQVSKAQHGGPGSVFRMYVLGGHEYVVPESAVPYLGRTLDRRLFDVTWLAAHPRQQLSVRLRLRPGAGSASVPGLHLTSNDATAASGTFSPASARAFGRALARQAVLDHASPSHHSGLFREIRLIGPAVGPLEAGLPVVARPTAVPDSVLTIKGINWAGAPDNGDSFNVYNVDDMSLFAGSISFHGGTAQLTVPDGHYSAIGYFYDFAGQRIFGVTLPQFTVHGDTTVTIDARDATAQVSLTTPLPATAKSTQMVFGRNDALGALGSYAFLAGNQAFSVVPVKKRPAIGELHYSIGTRQYSAGSKQPYTFDLLYGSDGTISSDQHYAPTKQSLASVDARYAADHPDVQSMDARLAALPWEENIFGDNILLTTPTRRTEYYSTESSVIWEGVEYQVADPVTFATQGVIDQSWRTYQAGSTESTTWGDDPTPPRLLERDIFPNQVVCPACIAGTTLDALAFPFGDSSPEHRTYPDQPTSGLSESAAWSVSADGDVAQQGTGVLQAAAAVGSASRYEIDYDTTRSSSDFLLSTKTRTAWTIPAGAPQADLPKDWTCTISGGTDCTVLGLMTATYHLPSDSTGRIRSGDATATITLGHLADLRSKVRSLKVTVSFDGGDTYTSAKVTKSGSGAYSVAFTVPPKGQTDGFGAISISAKDDLKGTLVQTTIRAFAVR